MRVMTFKSVLGFGYNNVRNKTVGSLISLGRHKLLIKAYYGLEKNERADATSWRVHGDFRKINKFLEEKIDYKFDATIYENFNKSSLFFDNSPHIIFFFSLKQIYLFPLK